MQNLYNNNLFFRFIFFLTITYKMVFMIIDESNIQTSFNFFICNSIINKKTNFKINLLTFICIDLFITFSVK